MFYPETDHLTCHVIFFSDQHLYEVVNHFLLHKPCLDVKDVPLFLSMLNSSSLQFNAERGWILKLLASGPRTSADYYIYKRRHVFEQIMALYHSPMCDATAKVIICFRLFFLLPIGLI